MRGARAWMLVSVLALLFAGLSASAAAAATVGLSPFLSGLNQPMYVTSPPGDSHRLFIVERPGVIQVAVDGVLQPTPFLDISANVWTTGEAGLGSMAFDPDFAHNGLFYVYFVHKPTGSQTNGPIDIEEFKVNPATPNVADPTSGRLVLEIPHNDGPNHYGGTIAFSPIDHLLYIAPGDGGGSNNQFGNAQNTEKSLLGKILRIDPHAVAGPPSAPYSIPPGNPFAGQPLCNPPSGTTNCPEILAWGLRNPFRWSFDRATGDLTIGDVGQSAWEEVDYVPASAPLAGDNFGWPCREGLVTDVPSTNPTCGSTGPFVDPVFTYSHSGLSGSVAITGGVVIRDPALGTWDGRYLYADFYAGRIHSLLLGTPSASDDRAEALPTVTNLVSFGQDADGHVYIVQLAGSSGSGTVQKLVCTDSCVPPPTDSTPSPQGQDPSPQQPAPQQTAKDTTPPHLSVHAGRRQDALRRGFVRLTITCDEDCFTRATGTARGRPLRGAIHHLRAHTPAGFKLRLTRRARRALAHRGAIAVTIRARDRAGNLRTKRLTIAVRRR